MQDVLKKVYRWNIQLYGGGLVFAESLDDAKQKVTEYAASDPGVSTYLSTLSVWQWQDDNLCNPEYPDILDIY